MVNSLIIVVGLRSFEFVGGLFLRDLIRSDERNS